MDYSNLPTMNQFGMNRGKPQPPKPKNAGRFHGDEDDQDLFMNNAGIFRPDKEMMPSGSPQLTGPYNTNLYSQSMSSGMNSMSLRMSGNSYQRSVTPTNMAPNFPISMPQQVSPNSNRSLYGGQRGIIQTSQAAISNQLKQRNSNSLASSIMSSQAGGISTSSVLLSMGMVSKPVQEPAPEFQIQPDDFPALPGTANPPATNSIEVARKTPTGGLGGMSTYEAALNKECAKFPGDKGPNQPRRGIQTHPDGTVSNIPYGMVTDQFGMVGLLTFIRATETDPNLVALAPGIDLTTLGLNLNSPENLYSTFQSPWADSPCRPQDIDFHVPQEYLTNILIREKLAPIKLNRYGEDLLFFLFYMNGGDVLQLASAAELYNRDWRYHKEERVWITRAPGIDPQLKTNSFEKGTYYFFDAQNWRKVLKEFRLEYDKLEERPHLPPTLHHNPNQPTIMTH